METVLNAGTWTNYESTPKGITLDTKGLGWQNVGIVIRNVSGEVVLAFDGTPIYEDAVVSVEIKTTSASDRDKLKADTLAIVKASDLPFGNPRYKHGDDENFHKVTLDYPIII